MGKLFQGIISLAAFGFGAYILLSGNVTLVSTYGKTLMLLGAAGIVATAFGTLFSSTTDHAEVHSKTLSIVYFCFVISFGLLTYFKGEAFIAYISEGLA